MPEITPEYQEASPVSVRVFAPRSTVLPALPFKLPMVWSANKLRLAPAAMVTDELAGIAWPPSTARLPPCIEVGPAYVLVPCKVSVPDPALVKPPLPEILPE